MTRSPSISRVRTGAEDELKTALVTGATGLVGSAASLALARDGWKIALICHQKRPASQALLREIRAAGGRGTLIEAELLNYRSEAPRVVAAAQRALGPIHLFVHAAAPPVTSSGWQAPPEDLETQFAVHTGAFLALTSALLPEMLRAQSGTLVALLSQAVLPPAVPGWQSYAIAKAALAQAINELSAAYGHAGIRTLGLMPGAIKGDKPPRAEGGDRVRGVLRPLWPMVLSAETVAEWVLRLAKDRSFSSGTVISLDSKGSAVGRCTSWSADRPSGGEHDFDDHGAGEAPLPGTTGVTALLHEVVRKTFSLDRGTRVERAKIGELDGWDSLGHVRLIMEVESAFGVRFTADEAVKLQSVPGIVAALSRYARKS